MNEVNGGRAELIPTRASLLSRLKNWGDQESWREFFYLYRGLIYHEALRHGLNEAEAEDVVQETMFSVAKAMPTFDYHREHGSFKSWLLKLTRWRIKDVLRKRGGVQAASCRVRGSDCESAASSLDLENDSAESGPDAPNPGEVPEAVCWDAVVGSEEGSDEVGSFPEDAWDREWEEALLQAAWRKVRRWVDAKNIQIFDLCVLRGRPVAKVAHDLHVSRARAYLARRRVGRLIGREIEALRGGFI